MKYKVEFDMDNASFYQGDGEFNHLEVMQVLIRLAKVIEHCHGIGNYPLQDTNGNGIGEAKVIDNVPANVEGGI